MKTIGDRCRPYDSPWLRLMEYHHTKISGSNNFWVIKLKNTDLDIQLTKRADI